MSHFYEITQEALGVDYTSTVTEGVWDSIKSTIRTIWEKVKSFFRWIIDKFKSLFGLDKSDKKEKAKATDTPKRYTEATFTIGNFVPVDKLQSLGEKFITNIKKTNKSTLDSINLSNFSKNLSNKEPVFELGNSALDQLEDEIEKNKIQYKVTISESKKKEIENMAKKYEDFVKRIEKDMEDDIKTTEQIADKAEKELIKSANDKQPFVRPTKLVRLCASGYSRLLQSVSDSGLALVKICKWFEGSQKTEELGKYIELVSGKN